MLSTYKASRFLCQYEFIYWEGCHPLWLDCQIFNNGVNRLICAKDGWFGANGNAASYSKPGKIRRNF